ncbi:MAG: YIP1 family protein [Cyanobacteria bacterium J06639_1]
MLALLDAIYGTWFWPDRAFAALKARPLIWQAGLVVIVLNAADWGRRNGMNAAGIALSAILGLMGWVVVVALLRLLAFSMGRDPQLNELLTLTAFGGLPWLFVAPAQQFGGAIGTILGLLALAWFTILEIKATAIALDLPWWRTIWLIPMAFLAGFLAIAWSASFVGVLASLN